jgi:hypothetical protein
VNISDEDREFLKTILGSLLFTYGHMTTYAGSGYGWMSNGCWWARSENAVKVFVADDCICVICEGGKVDIKLELRDPDSDVVRAVRGAVCEVLGLEVELYVARD